MSSYQPPVIKTPTVCEKCLALHELKDFLVERELPFGTDTVEGLLVCPSCGSEKHCYYMDIETLAKRSVVMARINVIRTSSDPFRKKYDDIQLLQRQFQQIFDDCQTKYTQLLEGLTETAT